MSIRRMALDSFNQVAGIAGVTLVPRDQLEKLMARYCPTEWPSPPIPLPAMEYLTSDNPKLAKLRAAYTSHPATGHTVWSDDRLLPGLKLDRFRGDNHYVYQVRLGPTVQDYYLAAYYMREHDDLKLFGKLQEDGLFGAFTLPFDGGYLISRDLLQSINEINFIARMLGMTASSELRLLDIGAGYGRLAHRIAEAMPNAHVTCTDAVPMSTFLSEFYLDFRGVEDRTAVVPLNEVPDLRGQTFDVVTNIHSFPECPVAVTDWWLGQVDQMDAKHLMIVPNEADHFRSAEANGTRLDFFPLFAKHGWKLANKEPIYRSTVAQKHAIYPNVALYWFERA